MKQPKGNPAPVQEALGPKYHVLRWIGGGGMAQVYLARNRDTGGLFAIKVLAEQFAGDDGIVARFLQEARTSAVLSEHPNIVSIFDVGQHESTHYIIMQYIDGEDLSDRLKRDGRIPPVEAAGIVQQIADALVCAHSQRIVHRDLKPSNIKLQKSGRVVVLDFGIAKAGDAPSTLTSTGQRVGTPYYMSPEHFVTGTCDARSDLYALGVVFYELLTGRRPFEGESIQDIEIAHREQRAPSPRDCDASIPEAYSRIVLRLLEKRPEDRYQSATELIADLTRTNAPQASAPPAAAAVPVPARAPEQPTALIPSGAPPTRHRTPLLAVASTVCAVAVVGAALYFATARTGEGKPGVAMSGTSSQSPGASLVDSEAVSNTVYKAFCDATGHPYPDPLPSDPNYFYTNPNAPVLNVGYRDAKAFAEWAGKRLPSAAEWDKASRVRASIAEWTSTPFQPREADTTAYRKLAGRNSAGDWFVVKGNAPLPGLPSEVAGGFRVGFRCVKDAAGRE